MSSATKPDFLTMAVSRNLISRGQSHELSNEAARLGIQPAQLAIEKGILDPAQVDIVQALSNPKEIAPGYEILDVLGYGGLGVVYRARQINLDRVVALKSILLSRMDRPGALARFELEAKAVARLRHPNIVTAYDYGTHEGRLYFAMEMIEGEDLDDRLKRMGRISEEMAWSIARQTASGLAHAAELNVIHRDIKPANLMLTRAPHGYSLPANVPMVKITDFGLAFLTSEGENRTRLTATGTTMGTPQYMAPEQLSEPTVDLRADIYALGATLYHLFAGVPPFAGETTGQVLANKIKGKKQDLEKLADGVTQASVQLVDDMMANDPNDRPQNYHVLIDRIDALAHIPQDVIRVRRSRAATLETISEVAPADVPSESVTNKGAATKDTASGTSLPTQEMNGRAPRFGLLRRLVVALLLAGGAAAAVQYGLRDNERFRELVNNFLPSDWSPIVSSDPDRFEGPVLIEGIWRTSIMPDEKLTDWTKSGGDWRVVREGTSPPALVGATGRLTRSLPLPKPVVEGARMNYNLRFKVDIRDAQAVDLQFSVVAPSNERHERFLVRLTQSQIALGRLDPATGDFSRVVDPLPMPRRAVGAKKAEYHDICIGRHDTHWLAYFDDELLGALPIGKPSEPDSLSLIVEGGTAQFKDLKVIELASPQTPHGRPANFQGKVPKELLPARYTTGNTP